MEDEFPYRPAPVEIAVLVAVPWHALFFKACGLPLSRRLVSKGVVTR